MNMNNKSIRFFSKVATNGQTPMENGQNRPKMAEMIKNESPRIGSN